MDSPRPQDVPHRKRIHNRGWTPHLDSNGQPSLYHSKLNALLSASSQNSLTALRQIMVDAATETGTVDRGPMGIIKPGKSIELQNLIAERRVSRDPHARKQLSKSILRTARKELRV